MFDPLAVALIIAFNGLIGKKNMYGENDPLVEKNYQIYKDSRKNYEVAQIFVQPVVFSLDSSIAFSVDVGKAIQSGQVDKFLLSILSAATAIAAQSSSNIRNRHLTQVFVVKCVTNVCLV